MQNESGARQNPDSSVERSLPVRSEQPPRPAPCAAIQTAAAPSDQAESVESAAHNPAGIAPGTARDTAPDWVRQKGPYTVEEQLRLQRRPTNWYMARCIRVVFA